MVKLSELIRKGAGMVKGQCFGDFISKRKDGVYCCALGAAYLAATGKYPPYERADNNQKVLKTIGELLDMTPFEIMSLEIAEMNDNKKWTFEQIARVLEVDGL